MREAESIPVRPPADIGPPPRGPGERRTLTPSDYPSADGKPMAESAVHREATLSVAQPLKTFYRDRPDVYVGSDMMMYYREGDRGSSVVPDLFVVFGVPKLPERDTWLVWLEGKGPDFVLEITSGYTRYEDEGRKRRLYAALGVREYWQFDPKGDYLDPILKGARLQDGRYRELVLDEEDGALRHSTMLGLELHLTGDQLRFFDPEQKQPLGNYREVIEETAWLKAETARVQVETARIKAETARIKAETARMEAECDEIKADTARMEADRVEIEAETARIKAEIAEIDAETVKAKVRIRELERRSDDD